MALNPKIQKALDTLAQSLRDGVYYPLENEQIELKGASTSGEWKSIPETINAFLNTEGGVLILGMAEKDEGGNRSYKSVGFNPNDEPKISALFDKFTSDVNGNQPINLISQLLGVHFDTVHNTQVAIVYVEKLPEDKKYCFLNGKAYRRIGTADKKLTDQEIAKQEAYRQTLITSTELNPIPNTELSAQYVSLDRINAYIHQYNQALGSAGPAFRLLTDLTAEDSLNFLRNRKFIDSQNRLTILGGMVTGRDPHALLGGRAQVDCWVESDQVFETVAADKQSIRGNLLELLEHANRFVERNTRRGLTAKDGGEPQPEYPIALTREVMNNALAHREYSLDDFVRLSIFPQDRLEISNPGRFRPEVSSVFEAEGFQFRRLLPNVTKPVNPNLADVLKVFDKWEGKGRGMNMLLRQALSNRIDIPYYVLQPTPSIKLVLRQGRVLDERMHDLFDAYSRWIPEQLGGIDPTEAQLTVLAYFIKSLELNRRGFYTIAYSLENNHVDAIEALERAKILLRAKHDMTHSSAIHYYPNPSLLKANYFNELAQCFDSGKDLFGQSFQSLSSEAKEVLNLLYGHQFFSKTVYLNARGVAERLYKKQGKAMQTAAQVREYESFQRRIRKIFSQLAEKGFIQKLPNSHNYQLRLP
jgi:predicted HTH transcriptional regulator